MKKYIFSIAMLAVGLSAAAIGLDTRNQKLNPAPEGKFVEMEVGLQKIAPQRIQLKGDAASDENDATEILYMPAADPYTALGFSGLTAGMQVGMAMQLDPDIVSSMSGNEITSVVFYTGVENDGTNINSHTKATIFISNDLTADPVYTQEATLPETSLDQVKIDLDTPYLIEDGKKIYVGVYYTLHTENFLPIVIDFTAHANDYGGWVGVRNNSKSEWSWDNIASYYGFVCVGAVIKGENFPKNNVAVTQVTGIPACYQETPFEVDFYVQNNGADDVTSLTVEYGVEGETSATEQLNFPEPLGYNHGGMISIYDLAAINPGKSVNVNVKVTEVNGVPNNSDASSGSYAVTVIPTGKGYYRNVVIEEFTSISCIYCPVGYTAMEYVHENYPSGDLIPVCVHVNSPGRDPMTANTFNTIFNKYAGGSVPSATMNRTYSVYPTVEGVVGMFDLLKTIPAIAQVKAEATLDEENRVITVDTKTAFAFDYTDGDSNFALSYAITEDNVGPYSQKNAYSGETGDYYGWQDQPDPVELMYNDVARQLDATNGVKGSVPAEITSGTEYEFNYQMSLVRAVSDVTKANLVVYLINKKTGEIENSVTLKAPLKGILSGIENVEAGTSVNAPVEYYNLQGVRVANPQGGVFIRRQGDKVSKEYVR